MADEQRPERPAIDFGRGSREQSQSGAGPKPPAVEIEAARRAPTKGNQAG